MGFDESTNHTNNFHLRKLTDETTVSFTLSRPASITLKWFSGLMCRIHLSMANVLSVLRVGSFIPDLTLRLKTTFKVEVFI